MSKTEPKPKKRRRSPNYPAIDLPSAIERVKKIYKADGAAGAPVNVAVKHIGYNSAHGQAMTVVSALQKYGLTENRNSRVIPTRRAIDIIEFQRGQPRFDAAVREAVLQPDMYREIVDRYAPAGNLPSDGSLRPELITDKGFNRNAVDGFLADMRKSLEFAGLLRGNVLSLSPEDDLDDEAPPIEPAMTPPTNVPRPSPNAVLAPNNATTTFSLDEGLASINWPADMGPESFRDFEAWVHVVLNRVARSAGVPDYFSTKADKN